MGEEENVDLDVLAEIVREDESVSYGDPDSKGFGEVEGLDEEAE